MTAHARRPKFGLILVRKTPDAKSADIVLIFRGWRSKWFWLECLCRRPRKDGTCWRTDRALELMTEDVRAATRRIAHPRWAGR